MSTAIPARVRGIVLARAAGMCEACGIEGRPLELHHRRYRSRGGRHDASNLVALCGWGNHTGCHGWAHTSREAVEAGFSVPSGIGAPSTFPVALAGRWWLLDDEGGTAPVNA